MEVDVHGLDEHLELDVHRRDEHMEVHEHSRDESQPELVSITGTKKLTQHISIIVSLLIYFGNSSINK